jgi:hypothetical protein
MSGDKKLVFLDKSPSFTCGFQIAIMLNELRANPTIVYSTDLLVDNLEQAKLCAEHCGFTMELDGPIYIEEETGNNFSCVLVVFLPKEEVKPKSFLTRVK